MGWGGPFRRVGTQFSATAPETPFLFVRDILPEDMGMRVAGAEPSRRIGRAGPRQTTLKTGTAATSMMADGMPVEASMAAVDDLKSFRRILVADRRKAAAEGVKPSADVAQWAQTLQTLQERIDAIDRAIVSEQTEEQAVARWDDPR